MGGQFLVYEIPCLSSCLLTDYIYIFLRRYSEDSFEINLVFLIKRERKRAHSFTHSFSILSSFLSHLFLFFIIATFYSAKSHASKLFSSRVIELKRIFGSLGHSFPVRASTRRQKKKKKGGKKKKVSSVFQRNRPWTRLLGLVVN